MFELPWRRRSDVASTAGPTLPVILTFTPPMALRAIEFHLIDEAVARRISDASREATIRRLVKASPCLEIRRTRWEQMTHLGRLQWLLIETGLLVDVTEDGVAHLVEAGITPDDQRGAFRHAEANPSSLSRGTTDSGE